VTRSYYDLPRRSGHSSQVRKSSERPRKANYLDQCLRPSQPKTKNEILRCRDLTHNRGETKTRRERWSPTPHSVSTNRASRIWESPLRTRYLKYSGGKTCCGRQQRGDRPDHRELRGTARKGGRMATRSMHRLPIGKSTNVYVKGFMMAFDRPEISRGSPICSKAC
jgi:hypothetical protein